MAFSMINGVGYNPLPRKPDPWEVALRKSLIKSDTEYLTWQANPVVPLPGATPGDPDVNEAWMDRYGLSVLQPIPMGAEFELTLWPRVLEILYRHEWKTVGYTGVPTPREIKDAALMADKGMICRALAYEQSNGYVADKPIRISDKRLPQGTITVPGRKARNEPAAYADYRSPYGCTQYYFNDVAPSTPPTPPPVAPPAPPVLPPPATHPLTPAPQRVDELWAWMNQKYPLIKPILVELLEMFRKAAGKA